MPVFVVTLRKQIAQTCLVEAPNATEAKRLARDGSHKCDWIGIDEIFDGTGLKPTVMRCHEDVGRKERSDANLT